MWSSIVNEEGSLICQQYLCPAVAEAALGCITSPGVGVSVGVAAMLCLNLAAGTGGEVQLRAPELAAFRHAFPTVKAALAAAFSGEECMEREWGPGPVTKALASLSRTALRHLIIDEGLLPLVCEVLTRADADWPIKGFTPDYYDRARLSAATVLEQIALHRRLPDVCHEALPALRAALRSDRLLPDCRAAVGHALALAADDS